MNFITLLTLGYTLGCAPKQPSPQGAAVTVPTPDNPFDGIEKRYEAFRRPLMVNPWNTTTAPALNRAHKTARNTLSPRAFRQSSR